MRTITISALKATGVDTWSVKDNSVRGYTTRHTSEVKVGDKVVIDNYFTLVVEEKEDFMKVREVITLKGWVEGSGWSYQETYADQIINIVPEQLQKPMDWSWWETDEVEQTEGEDTKIIVRYYNPDDDLDVAEPIAEFEVWESDLINSRTDEL